MIKIDRSRVSEPEILTKPFPGGKTEKQRAIDHYAPNPERTDSFEFQRYSHGTVKTALNELFHGKCAYCESKIIGTQPTDVEHFRPKGAVKVEGKLERPGYYWLAADWDNLLPSCIDCNRERNQEFPDTTIKLAGKANWFPVEGTRIKSHEKDVYTEEACLLLHPCHDDALEHLEFTVEGIVRGVDRRGEVSTEVFALDRNGLVALRRDHARRVLGQKKRVRKRLQRLAQDDQAEKRDDLIDEIEDLFSYAPEEEEYAGMARQIISRALEEYRVFAQAHLTAEQQAFFEEQIAKYHWPTRD